MAVLDAILIPSLTAADLLGLELHFMERVASRAANPVMLVYALAGRAISIGRHHLYDGPAECDGITLTRRLTGGRIVGAGEGWIGVALILPHLTALLPERDARIKPDQVINRYARGLLAALDALKLKCFYPGRDAVTLDRRELAMCSFETDSNGALLFEASLALSRGMHDLVLDLEHADPDGRLACAMYDSENSTTLARELNREPGFSEIADALMAGYRAQHGAIDARDLTADETKRGRDRGATLMESGWLQRRLGSEFKLASRMTAQLGAIETRIALRDNQTIDHLMLAGDFIANSPGLTALDRELRGACLDFPTMSRAVVKTFAGRDNYFLGIGDLSNLVQLIVKAA
ncbi:MAG TPA: hypothetical protein VMA09_08675 [Candidatus Binataceae bacterium]|nr:hypothetical protein [Candidatus Binataceae bacterium]